MPEEVLKIDFQNCYGINNLKYDFQFGSIRVFAIYAANGTMKTSFAKTFQDYINGISTKDEIFPTRITTRKILNDNEQEVSPNSFFVIEPYQDNYHAPNVAKLLVNPNLKEAYNKIYQSIEDKKDVLLKKLKNLSNLKLDEIEKQFSLDITTDEKQFVTALQRISQEVAENKYKEFSHIPYKKIFNEKVDKILKDPEIKIKIKNYITKYDQLLTKSTFFKKGIFTHNNASDIAKNLKENGFFKASHSVNVFIQGKFVEIKEEKQLETLIEEEKNLILSNPELKHAFEILDSKLTKNKDLKDFRDLLEENQFLFSELENLSFLAQKLWISYCVVEKENYSSLKEEYLTSKTKIDEILTQAKQEETNWHKVVDIFNKRFKVPFVIKIANQEDVLTQEAIPVVSFDFLENNAHTTVEEALLKKVLSNGEKRALYLLNIIFEIEIRKESKQKTFFIIDDIADSFDYKNKYAIIEYLQDLSQNENFFQIILSHNFDFYRTISSRLDIPRGNRLHTKKEKGEILLEEEKYQNNPFKYWVQNLDNNPKILLASIPFFRNIAEYLGKNEIASNLTSFLHLCDGTLEKNIEDLEQIIKNFIPDFKFQTINRKQNYVKFILAEAIEITQETLPSLNLEEKIVLAIAIRLLAEQFVLNKIDTTSLDLSSNQTRKLVKEYKKSFPDNTNEIQMLEEVALITPEGIHLNSFMYEPILDLDIQKLISLFESLKNKIEPVCNN